MSGLSEHLKKNENKEKAFASKELTGLAGPPTPKWWRMPWGPGILWDSLGARDPGVPWVPGRYRPNRGSTPDRPQPRSAIPRVEPLKRGQSRWIATWGAH